MITFPSVAKTFDFGSNFASEMSVAGFLLHSFFQSFVSASHSHNKISLPALNNRSNHKNSMSIVSIYAFEFAYYEHSNLNM